MKSADPVRQAKHEEIKRRYARRRRRSSKARTKPQIAALRLNDLAKLFRGRYGLTLPDDDAGRDDLAVALAHIATLSKAHERMVAYCEVWAPWLQVGEAKRMMVDAFANQQHWKADQLAWRMRLTAADRTTLGITTIGAIDLPKHARANRRKARSKARSKAWRKSKRAANTP